MHSQLAGRAAWPRDLGEQQLLVCHPAPLHTLLPVHVPQDEDDGYTGEPLSKWMANKRMGKNSNPNESRAVFVVRHMTGRGFEEKFF